MPTLAEQLAGQSAPTQTAGDSSTKLATTAFVSAAITAAVPSQIQPAPTPTFSANAMTIPAQQYGLTFRSTTLSSGASSTITGTPAALTVPSGATLGFVSGQSGTIALLVLNNAGTLEYAVVNLAGGTDLSETGLVSTTAISASATSTSVIYSTTARTNVAYRVVARYDQTQATAGAWVTAPSLIQGVGGQAFSALSGLGMGQKISSPGKSLGVTYYNTTGRPIFVSIVWANLTNTVQYGISVVVNNIGIGSQSTSSGGTGAGFFFVVPPGGSYYASAIANTPSISWTELS
jgi:hypothetical protein